MSVFFVLAACFDAGQSIATEAVAAETTDWKHFGAPFTLASSVPAAQVFANPEASVGKTVRITGQLTEVCQSMGCWAVVRDDRGATWRVTMKGHAFGIDKDTAGRTCDVEGTVAKKPVDPKTVEHYASEGSKNAPEAGKAEVYEISATGVSVSRS